MKNHKKTIITIITFCLFFSNYTYSASKKEDISNLLKLSGITEVVEQIPMLIGEGFIQGFTEELTVTDEEKKLLIEDVNQSFKSSLFQNQFHKIIENELNEVELNILLNWYKSDLGILITKAESKSSSEPAYNAILKNTNSLMKDTKRLEMAKRIDGLLNETEHLMKLQNKIGISVFTGIISSLVPDESSKLIAEFEAENTEMDDMIRAETQQFIFASFIYTYQDINDSDMGKYESFLNSDAFQKFDDAMVIGLENGFDLAIPLFSKKLGSTILNISSMQVPELTQ